jgi:hypothetical protein
LALIVVLTLVIARFLSTIIRLVAALFLALLIFAIGQDYFPAGGSGALACPSKSLPPALQPFNE